MESFKKILRTPSAFVLVITAVIALIGVIIQSNTSKEIVLIPINATSTAEARMTQNAQILISASPTPMIIKFTVVSDQPWQNAQVDIQQDDKVLIRYIDGFWQASPDYEKVGADGYKDVINDANNMVYGALLAKIGDGVPFEVGSSYSFTAKESGYLFLQINDNVLTNNSGNINVEIQIER